MKLSNSFVLYQLVQASPGENEIKQLNKYRQLAKNFFDDHGDAFRQAFVDRWVGDAWLNG